MSTKLPYVVQPGSIPKIFEKVRQAQTPDRFTVDFLQTKLGFRGGNYRQFIPLAKKLGFLATDGKPTDHYKRFRNVEQGGAAMAAGMRLGYRELFERNEYANNLNKEQLKGLIVEITGMDAKDRVVDLICQTFEALKKLANFEGAPIEEAEQPGKQDESDKLPPTVNAKAGDVGLNLAYTINLVLPKSDDPAVFNAIFKALREHLLRK
ncbi:MAG: DUF5343 domain-containing protein [Nitrospiraceae bacterium]|jgi:hypothetical protein|uniref:DUF5343 domain-containing protein n=1 Tax=Nitrospira cf. moscoviensis SBR1015 TaxID=96242 RepID=UPI000A0E69A6|nr:DUF5343 domain-containing protein [Nitrospira cf. moscoviensis SBR1015]MBY0247835.1 DUF5343 domain-containing protein [Nitrospiraceae bacterium]OQW37202.1 MAG: hypothetical protein A4E20_05960 [Nitrospira sp. SG-bin2]